MIQKKRINNDVFVRWGVFTPEGLPVDLTEVTSITIEARPQSSNGRYPMVSEVVDNFVEAYFLAKDQKVVGKYNLYLTYTIDDPNIIGGVATYTIDYCDAFELLPKSCFIDGEDDVDPVNIQGIIASFTYSMLTEEEKNDLASRLSGNSGAQNLSDLLDVTISNLEIDQILKYDGTKWVNATPTGGSSSNVSWGIPTSQYTPLTVNGVTRNLSLNNHTHHWDTITNRPLTDEQFQDLLEIASLWKLDNDGNLYTERNVYSHGEVSAYNWGESPTPPVGVYNLKDLLDVGIINPQENNILRFNGSHWVNVPSSNVGTLVEWSSETDNYINLLVGDSSKSISLHGHKHEIGDINNLQDSLDFKQDNIPLGDISQYYRGDKEWAPLNTDTVVESTNLYYTPERVIGLTGGLYAQKDHTHVFNSLTGLPNTLDGYGIIDAYNKTEIDNLISSTSGFWVKSVGIEAPTGFTVSNSPIIYEGNIKLSFASGYSLPSNSKQYNWDLAFSDRHTHTNISVLNELTIDDVNNWNSIQEHLNDYNNPHQVSFKQLINKPSTLLGYGITDVYSKTEVDYIFNNITPGEPTIKNVYGYDSIDQSFSDATLTDTFNAHTISRLHDRLTILEQGDTNQWDPILDTIINWYNNIGRYWLLDANNDALYTNKNVYSTKGVSAYGFGSGGGSGSGGALYDLADVTIPNRTTGDLLVYNGTHWVNQPQSSIIPNLTGYATESWSDNRFALKSHSHTIAQVTGLQTALDSKQATLTQGSNITITGSTISAVDTTYGVATTSANGLMSSADKSKLNGIAAGANKYVHPASHPASMITGLHASATTGVAGSVAWGNVTGKPSTFAPATHTHSNISITAGNGLTGGGTLSANRTLALDTTYADNRYVTLTTTQTISGAKTFNGSLTMLNGVLSVSPTEGTLGIRTIRLGGSGVLWQYRPTSIEAIRTGIGFGWHNTEWVIGNIRGGSSDSYGFGIGYRNNSTNQITGAFRIATNGTAYLNNVQIATVNSNVASATKLNTARTIWGQSFNGTGNVSGAITGATTGAFSGAITATNFVSTVTSGFMFTGAKATVWNAFGAPAGGGFSFVPNGGTLSEANAALTIAANKNVGIGTITPTYNLDVSGTGRFTGNVTAPKVSIGSNWSLELSGTELQIKYGGVVKQRMFQDGSFAATGEVAAYSQGTAADELQLNKLTLLQGGGISKYLSSTATQVYFDIDGATPLTMSKTEVRRGTSDNNVNLGTSAYPWANIYGVNLIASTNISTPKITLGNGWTIEQTSASLTIRRNGVIKGTFTA